MNKPVQSNLLPLDTSVENGQTLGEYVGLTPEDVEQDEIDRKRWRADDPDIVIHCQPTTSVYRNPFDGIVIRQQGDYPDEDPYVVIRPENLPALIARLQRFLPR